MYLTSFVAEVLLQAKKITQFAYEIPSKVGVSNVMYSLP